MAQQQPPTDADDIEREPSALHEESSAQEAPDLEDDDDQPYGEGEPVTDPNKEPELAAEAEAKGEVTHEEHDSGTTLVALHPTLALLVGGGGAVLLIAGLRQIGATIAPTFLVVTLVIAIYPMYLKVRRVVPDWIAGIGMLLTLFAVMSIIIAGVAMAAQQLITVLPNYSSQFQNLVNEGHQALRNMKVSDEQINKFTSGFDLNNFVGIARQVAASLGSIGTMMLFMVAASVIMVLDVGGFQGRMEHLRRVRPSVANSLTDFAERVRKYWVVSTVFGVIVAVLDTIALMIIGVPLAITWGFLAFVTNYIPNIGFVLGLVPPALLATLDGGVSAGIWVVVIYCVLNVVIQTILQPKFTGDAVGISATMTFLSLAFWSYVFGALGAILAIPLTLLVKALFIDRDSDTRWINTLVSTPQKEES